jgi:hypothetical protein
MLNRERAVDYLNQQERLYGGRPRQPPLPRVLRAAACLREAHPRQLLPRPARQSCCRSHLTSAGMPGWPANAADAAVCDGYACWDPAVRYRIRVVCARPYHALFAHNMLIRWVGRDCRCRKSCRSLRLPHCLLALGAL